MCSKKLISAPDDVACSCCEACSYCLISSASWTMLSALQRRRHPAEHPAHAYTVLMSLTLSRV